MSKSKQKAFLLLSNNHKSQGACLSVHLMPGKGLPLLRRFKGTVGDKSVVTFLITSHGFSLFNILVII